MAARIYRPLAILLALTLLVSSISPLLAKPNDPAAKQPELAVQYGRAAQEAVKVKLTNQVVNANGSITANLSLEAPAALTYGLNLAVVGGEVSGPALNELLIFTSLKRSIPFVGGRILDIGRVTFQPGSDLKILAGKWGNYDDDPVIMFVSDACTAITLAAGLGFLPTSEAEQLDGLYDATVGLVEEFNQLGLDVVALTAQLRSGDMVGAFQTIGGIMELAPESFADFLNTQYKLPVSANLTKALGKGMRTAGPIISTLPLIIDLFKKPSQAEVHIRYLGTPEKSAGRADIVLVLDRSGSMQGQPLADAQTAAKLFVDLTQPGDRLGVVSFSSGAEVNHAIAAVTANSKRAAREAIGAISASGYTSIGAGLQLAQQQLAGVTAPNGKQAIVLLSDGEENEAPYVADVLPAIVAAGTIVHTIGLGPAINAGLLQDVANQTGGLYRFAPNSADLAGIYNSLLVSLSGQQQVASGSAVVAAHGSDTQAVLIGSQQATFTINWPDTAVDLDLSLVMPDGTVVQPDPTDPAVEYVESLGYEFYRITPPMSGAWSLNVNNPTGEEQAYSFLVTLVSQLEMDVYLSTNEIDSEEDFLVTAVLYDSAGPITGAVVTARFAEDNGYYTTLSDEGIHVDNKADDGMYLGWIDGAPGDGDQGSYLLHVEAAGPGFTRQEALTVVVGGGASHTTDLWVAGSCPETITLGNKIRCEIVYGSLGPYTPVFGEVSYRLPPNTRFVSSTAGTAEVFSGVFHWFIYSPIHSHGVFTITVLPEAAGTVTSVFNTTNVYDDPVSANNRVTLITVVEEPAHKRLYIPVVTGQ